MEVAKTINHFVNRKNLLFYSQNALIIISLFIYSGCVAQNNPDRKMIPSILDTILNKPTGLSYPKNAREVIERLNAWDKKELDAYERPNAYPMRDWQYYIPSGETYELIISSKEILKKINIEIIWNVKKKRYELKPYQTSDNLPKLLNTDLKNRVKDGMTLGETIEILGLGWMHPGESTGIIRWFFADGSILKVLPSAYNSTGIIKIINN